MNPDVDVIVVGAGAAGLAAARELARQSLKVLILEARDRIGGRVLWHRLPRVKQTADLGAEFIHGSAPQTRQLLAEIGDRVVEPGDESWMRAADGTLCRDEVSFSEAAARALEHARHLRADESAETFLHRLESDPKSRDLADAARAFVEGFEAADPSLASIRSIAEELHTGVDSLIARPVGGYGPMFEHLRDVCVKAGVSVRLSERVRRVAWHRGEVVVFVRADDGSTQALRSRAAIVTLPIGVLKNRPGDDAVAFEPELPARMLDALGCMEMGHAVKVALWFRSPFWERLAHGRYRNWSFARHRGSFSAFWTQAPERTNLVIAWAGGPNAQSLAARSQAEVMEQALNELGDLFGEAALVREDCEGTAMHDWAGDPFARGVYSYVKVGGLHARAALTTPLEDSVFFAGEASSTDGQGGTVNGALETGERAARRVIETLHGRSR